jgi:TP901 family phage tail tape measure protein
MAKNERYVTTIELNSQQATDRLNELEKKVKDLKKAKEEAAKTGGFFDEKELKKTVREANNLRAQIQGINGILDNITDMTRGDLEKAAKELRKQTKNMLPDSDECKEAERQLLIIEDRIKELKNSFRETHEESKSFVASFQNYQNVMKDIRGATKEQLVEAQKYLEYQLSIASEGDAHYKSYNQNLLNVKGRLEEIKREQQVIVFQIDKYEEEIKRTNKSLEVTAKETELVDKTLKNLSHAKPVELEYSIKILNEELRYMPHNTDEAIKKMKQLEELNSELDKIRYEGKGKQSLFNRTADFFNKIQGSLITGMAAISGISLTIRKTVEEFAKMEEEMANVKKYTGLDKQAIQELNEEFKKMNTRTSREELNQLAGAAGRLGITSKEGLMEFVEAADTIKVALGDDLGEGAVDQIGKLAMAFGEDEKEGLRGAMLKTGSAVNELAQNSAAKAGYLVDFTARVAGFAKQIGLTQAQIMGFGTVMDENLLRDEMAATAFGNMLTKMQTDTSKFAKIAGKDVEEFSRILREDANQAILMLADNLKKQDPSTMMKMLDDMGLDGSRAVGVLSTLADKIDDVRKHQETAMKAYEEGTSVTKEFDEMNNTVQARMDKCKKQFKEMSIELGEKLLPVVHYTISGFGMFVKALSVIFSFITSHWKILTVLTSGVVAYTVAMNWATVAELKNKAVKGVSIALDKAAAAAKAIDTAATVALNTAIDLFTGKVTLATVAQRIWNKVIMANPYAAAAVAVMTLVAAIVSFIGRTREATRAQRDLQDAADKARIETIGERTELQNLVSTARNKALADETRRGAIKKLQEKYPDYLRNLSLENINSRNATTAIDNLTKSLLAEAKARILVQKIQEAEKEKTSLDEKYFSGISGLWQRIKADWQATWNDVADKAERFSNTISSLFYHGNLKGWDDDTFISKNGYGVTTATQWLNNYNAAVKGVNDSLETMNKELKEQFKIQSELNGIVEDKIEEPGAILPYKTEKELKEEERARAKAERDANKADAEKQKRLKALDDEAKARTASRIAVETALYSKGERLYLDYMKNIHAITLQGYNERIEIYDKESDEAKKLLNEREQYHLKMLEREERISARALEREHNSVTSIISASFYDPNNDNYMNEVQVNEELFRADMDYLQKKLSLYIKGSEEYQEIKEEMDDRQFEHAIEKERQYQEMLLDMKEHYLQMTNEEQKQIALNGLEELKKEMKDKLSDGDYNRIKIAIEAQYSNAKTPSEQAKKTGSDMLKVASDKAKSDIGDKGNMPFFGTIKQYQATMEQLRILYADDKENHDAYLAAKHQATAEFCAELSSQFQAAYNSINQIMSAASSLYSAQAEYETAIVKKKYEKQIAAAGNNQKKVKKLQEKQAKEEAAIKSKYNARQVKIQIAQAIAQTAMNALNAYGSVVGIPIVGPALAVVAAAAAVAAGMIQVAAIKKQAQAQEAGYYSGGFTGGRRYKKEAGVVHEGEWVANHKTVNNPEVRPVLDFIDRAQRNNTVGSLTADDISRQLGQGGAAVVAPVVNVSTDNEELRGSLDRSREVNERLLTVIEKKGIKVVFPLDSFDREYKHFQKLNDR